MKNQQFQKIRIQKPKKNSFDLSHERKMSLNMAELVPVYVQDVVPGDTFKVNQEVLMRMAPMVSPMMHRVNVFLHSYFVPYRLVYNEFEDFITGGPDGDLQPVFPKLTVDNTSKYYYTKGRLPDYMGVPTLDSAITVTKPLDVSALPFRAYQLIYNEYYRDQNLTDPIEFSRAGTLDSGDDARITQLRRRCWEKDYFTSALPWAQRGTSMTVPLGQVEPVYKDISQVRSSSDDLLTNLEGTIKHSTGGSAFSTEESFLRIENLDTMDVDPTTLNDLRTAWSIQKWLEKNARGGARYIEQILSHFGVTSRDQRLQRPEYLGGGKQPIVVSEVLQTSGSSTDAAVETDSPQGTMAGHGISVGSNNAWKKTFDEHGVIITIMSVLPRTAYMQGLDRNLQKFDRFDWYFPEFAHLGEQEIYNNELYHDYTTDSSGTFGYQSRYSEMKFKASTVHGDFRDSLEFWHMARKFTAKPVLNSDFVQSTPTHNIFAVTDPTVDKLYCQLYNQVRAIRPMPIFGTPS